MLPITSFYTMETPKTIQSAAFMTQVAGWLASLSESPAELNSKLGPPQS